MSSNMFLVFGDSVTDSAVTSALPTREDPSWSFETSSLTPDSTINSVDSTTSASAWEDPSWSTEASGSTLDPTVNTIDLDPSQASGNFVSINCNTCQFCLTGPVGF